jgi:nodulation protein E
MMMERRRVAITGIGVISALGNDREQFWDGLSAGRHGFGTLEGIDLAALRFNNGGQVRGYDAEQHFEPRQADLLDRFAQFATVAAREAVRDAGLDGDLPMGERAAVLTGSCVGGQTTQETGFHGIFLEGRQRPPPLTIPKIMANAGASQISLEFGITGPGFTTASACSSSNHAIGLAYWMVRHGLVDRAVTGGSEAPFVLGNLKAWDAMRVVAPDVCRPFSRDRKGMMLGEGGAMLVLEPLEEAVARGARIYAEIVGFGMSSDAHHLTQPSPDGGLRAMRAALDDAGVRPEQVGYVNAHGTGTAVNDPIETRGIRELLGAHADRVAVSSTKSMHGHTLGAAGAIEAAATALALHHRVLPPTANHLGPGPDCDLDVIPNEARPAQVEVALSNSFAFGGLNAVLALRSYG